MIGQSVGSYSIQRELGRGGMGAVYVGHHALLGRAAAVKVLLPEFSRNQDIVQRFFNEARAATAIQHPGIVEIYDFGFATDGSAYIVMELCQGESLAARIKRLGVLPLPAALAIVRQIAAALGAAHKAGIVHRDLKPDNVFVVPDDEVAAGERIKLLDFGIAKLAGDTTSPGMARTSTGAIMGTPLYMSPEQCRGAGQVDARSDLYALGCMLFEMLCGRVPFVGEGAGDIISGHILLAPPMPRSLAPGVPQEVEQLILWLLAKKPADRPQNADVVVAELHRLSGSSPGTSGPQPQLAPAHAPYPPSTVLTPAPGSAMASSAAHAPTVAPMPTTTLRDATGQSIPPGPHPSRKVVWIALAVSAVAAIAVSAVLATRGGGDGGGGGGTGTSATTQVAATLMAVRDAIDRHDAAGARAELDHAEKLGIDESMLAPLRAELAQLTSPASDAATAIALADAAPAANLLPADAPTIVLGPMGGASIQNAAIAEITKVAPDFRVQREGEPGFRVPREGEPGAFVAGRSFYFDTSDVDVKTEGSKITCELKLVMSSYPDRSVFGFVNGKASVDASRNAADLDGAKSDCVQAVVENLLETKAIPAVRERLAGPVDAGVPVVASAPPDARPRDTSHDDELASARKKMEHLIQAHDCDAARNLAETVRLYGEAGTKIAKLAGTCQPIVEPTTGPPKRPPEMDSGSGGGTAAPAEDVPTLVADANDAAKNGQWAKAKHDCMAALQQDRGNADALTICALATCHLKEPAHAKEYIARLSGQRAMMATQVCLRNGVNVGD